MRWLLITAALLASASCTCRGDSLVQTGDELPGHDAGTLAPAPPGTVTPNPQPQPMPNPGSWCASDCDCPAGNRCVSATSELTQNTCEPGTNTCATPCSPSCGAGTQCVAGFCQTTPCVGTNCVSGFPVSVAGTYRTFYELDISRFAQSAASILKILDILSAALSGQVSCGSQSTPEGKLMCIVVSLVAQNIHAPPWVQTLLDVLSGIFKFGNHPIISKGTMQLAETADGRLTAAETWSEMWLDYNGMFINVMSSPTLGTNGQIDVTVKAFGGNRDASNVYLGPRNVEFDVNKLLVNLINVAIVAGSQNQAHDVGELIELILCKPLGITNANYLVCVGAAQSLASQFELPVGLGGVDISDQRAKIYDADNNGIADSLGTATMRGQVSGEMSNGLVSGALGAFPSSNWYGLK